MQAVSSSYRSLEIKSVYYSMNDIGNGSREPLLSRWHLLLPSELLNQLRKDVIEWTTSGEDWRGGGMQAGN